MQNSFDPNNRFSCFEEETEDRMDTGLLDLSQAQLEEEFKDDLPGDISEIEPTGTNRMDITATTDAQDMSGLVLNNSMTVTPTLTSPTHVALDSNRPPSTLPQGWKKTRRNLNALAGPRKPKWKWNQWRSQVLRHQQVLI